MRFRVDMVSLPIEFYDEDCAEDAEQQFVDYIRDNVTTAWVEAVEDAPAEQGESAGTSANTGSTQAGVPASAHA